MVTDLLHLAEISGVWEWVFAVGLKIMTLKASERVSQKSAFSRIDRRWWLVSNDGDGCKKQDTCAIFHRTSIDDDLISCSMSRREAREAGGGGSSWTVRYYVRALRSSLESPETQHFYRRCVKLTSSVVKRSCNTLALSILIWCQSNSRWLARSWICWISQISSQHNRFRLVRLFARPRGDFVVVVVVVVGGDQIIFIASNDFKTRLFACDR